MSLCSDTAEYKLYITNGARKFTIPPVHKIFIVKFEKTNQNKINIYIYIKQI